MLACRVFPAVQSILQAEPLPDRTIPCVKAVRSYHDFRASRPSPHAAYDRPYFHAENTMRGRIVYVMGASGTGKDSLIREMRQRLRGFPVTIARRYITRPHSGEGERHIAVSHEGFAKLADNGHFALQWSAHGCRYGISLRAERALEQGISVIVNGSRTAFSQAVHRYPDLLPVLVTAPSHLLRERLARRGRESEAELEERLSAASFDMPGDAALSWILIDNAGPLKEAADVLERALHHALFMPSR